MEWRQSASQTRLFDRGARDHSLVYSGVVDSGRTRRIHMPPSKTSLNAIQDFLAQKRIAFVGVSRDPKDFSCSLFREFVKRGYDVVPVNPNASEVMGRQTFKR